jgi:tetratricopeptide (TPR) repeat protein
LQIENLIDHAERLKEKSSYPQSLRLFKKAFEKCVKKCDPDGLLRCLLSLGDVYRMTGNFEHASKDYSEAIELAGRRRQTICVADARVGLGLSLRALGKWKEALKLIRGSVRVYRKADDREGLAFSLWAEAGALRIQGRIAESIKTFKKSLTIFKSLKNKQGTGYCLCGLGGTHRVAGLVNDSLKYYTEANLLFSRLKDRFGTAYSYCGIGNACRMMGDYKSSLMNFSKAVDLYKKIGDRVSYSYTLWSLGTTYKMIRNFHKARDNFRNAMLLFKKTKDPRGIVYCRLSLGEIDFLEGRKARAVKHLDTAFREAAEKGFAIEKCHAATILSYISENNPPMPLGQKGMKKGAEKRQVRFSEKINDKCYNRLGLKLKFRGLPFNIP